ncbi:MAG: TlpA disulfide reductase family protein [Phycisphaeraceae bacterium]
MIQPTKTLLAPLLALWLLLAPEALAQDKQSPNLAKMDLGSYVTGPDINGRDLRGRVVVVEYWGITCGPCIAAIPHTTKLAEDYGHEKLVIIANQSWSASDKQCKEVWEEHAKSNFVAVRNGAKLPGFTTTSVPRAVVFDHNGKFLWEGHPGGMDRIIADAVKNVPDKKDDSEDDEEKPGKADAPKPDPIVTGVEAAYFEREIAQINEQDRSIASTLAKLRRVVDKSPREDQAAEAKAIIAQLTAWLPKQQSAAETALPSDPATAYAIADRTSDWLGRDTLADPFNAIKKRLEADRDRMDTIRATLMLREVEALAESIGLTTDPAAASDRKNAAEVRVITRDLNRIAKAWPDTDAGKRAAELLETWGMDD